MNLRALLAVLLLAGSAASARAQAYRDASRPVAERVRDLLGRMTLEEKFWQLFMIPGNLDDSTHDYSHGVFGLQIDGPTDRINSIQRYFVEHTRLGIPIIPFEEALHGLVRPGATVFPQAIALAASWDTTLMERVAGAIARETRSQGVRQVLSPVINVANDVRWGRTEETFGEDPYMVSRMGDAFITAFERAGIVTTPKHFVANVGEGGRDSYPIEVSPRMLEELFFPPFESAVRRGARSVMTAYNSVDGQPATQNPGLLNGTLRTRWGFRGFVISDAAATGGATVLHMTEPNTPAAARHAWEAGLDVVFQSAWHQHRPYWAAVRDRLVAPSLVDSAVARVLRVKFALGLFEQPYVNPDSAAFWSRHASHRALALEAARAGIVLLRNERGALPLSRSARSIAVIGTDAREARLGGYSARGTEVVTIVDGVRAKLGASATVAYAPGPGRDSIDVGVVPGTALLWDSAGTPLNGLQGEYFDNITLSGTPKMVRVDRLLSLHYTFNSPGNRIAPGWFSARWTGRVTVPADGAPRRIGFEGSDGWRLYLDDRLVIDNWRKQSSRRLMTGPLEPGRTYAIRFEFFETTGNAIGRLVWDTGRTAAMAAAIDSAVAVARRSDVAIVVAGIEEGEFRDRSSLALPGLQERMIEAVAATGKPVVVVLVGGSAITMSRWIDRVGAVIDVWYPGEAGGTAVADVLFGDYNPAGRLPVTFPMAEGQLPLRYNHKPTGRGDWYLDLTGQPLFPFGFGLSYTTFEYSDLRIEPVAIGPAGSAVVRCRVRNTGRVAGDEVVQLYVRDALASVAQPVIALKGFRRVHVEPGQTVDVSFTLGPESLSMLDASMRRVVEPGSFDVMVGASSKDIRLRGELLVR